MSAPLTVKAVRSGPHKDACGHCVQDRDASTHPRTKQRIPAHCNWPNVAGALGKDPAICTISEDGRLEEFAKAARARGMQK